MNTSTLPSDKAVTLSVVMPNYNHARFIPESIEGILSQSHPADEVIVVDDGSTDESLEVLRKLATNNPQLRLIELPKNVGVNKAFEAGLISAKGEWICAASADDLLLPGYFETALNTLQKHPEAGICCGMLGTINSATGAILPGSRPFPLSGYFSPAALEPLIRKGFTVNALTSVVRRTSLIDVGGFPSNLQWYGDWFALNVIAFREGACLLPKMVAAYRPSPTSYSNSASISDKRPTLRLILDLLDSPQYADVRKYFRMGVFHSLRWPMFSVLIISPRMWKWISMSYLKLMAMRMLLQMTPAFTHRAYRRYRVRKASSSNTVGTDISKS